MRYALGQIAPGPIVNLSVFIGYQAGGLLGSIVAALGVFAPAFAWVPVAVPLMNRFKHLSWMKNFDPLWTQFQRGVDEGFIKPEFLDLWYPAPDVDALLRYLEGYEPHRYGLKWTR